MFFNALEKVSASIANIIRISSIGKHLRDAHNQKNKDLREQLTILKKCQGKFECLIYEMLFIQEKQLLLLLLLLFWLHQSLAVCILAFFTSYESLENGAEIKPRGNFPYNKFARTRTIARKIVVNKCTSLNTDKHHDPRAL